MTRIFVPGLELSRRFYEDVVDPCLPGVPHAAGLLGAGSEVLGFDTPQSTDHAWGPRVQVWVDAASVDEVRTRLTSEVPKSYAGWPTDNGLHPPVEVDALAPWFTRQLGFDPTAGIGAGDWAATPSQLLLSVTVGAVHRDDTGDLARIRAALAWYPRDVWVWLMAVQWRRISQEEHLFGRTAQVGDALGTRILGARLVRDAMRLAFLQERRYPPYAKWFGSAFATLAAAGSIGANLSDAVAGLTPTDRHAALMRAFEWLAERQNDIGIGDPSPTRARRFHDRPFDVIGADKIADRLAATVTDDDVRALGWLGAVDQWVDSTDALSNPSILPTLRRPPRPIA